MTGFLAIAVGVRSRRTLRCLNCDYILDHLPSERCPECGTEAGSNRPRTTYRGNQLSRFDRWLIRPPGIPSIIVAALISVTILDAMSLPSIWVANGKSILASLEKHNLVILVAGGFIAWGLGFFLRLFAGIVVSLVRHISIERRPSRIAVWFIVPMLLFVPFAFADTPILWKARVLVSSPFLEAFRSRIENQTPGSTVPQPDWIGLIPCESVRSDNGDLRITVCSDGWLFCEELRYCESFSDQAESPIEYDHIFGHWYMTKWE